jgi:hypothetical protein
LEGGELRYDTFTVADGVTVELSSDTVIVVEGATQIDGRLVAESGAMVLNAQGDLIVTGTLRAVQDPDSLGEGDEPGGIQIVVSEGLTFDDDAIVESNGNIYVVDNEEDLALTPQQIIEETDSASGDLPTLVPLPPDDPVFTSSPSDWLLTAKLPGLMMPRTQPQPPLVIGGNWDRTGWPGDEPIMVFRFNGQRDLVLTRFTVSGPAAPDGDIDEPDSGDARARNGKNGMRLNIRNANGSVDFRNATLNLTDGGDGGDATATCGVAIAGDGGESGNFRATGGRGINIDSLTINPGIAGFGGNATATCDQPGGDAKRAEGGDGADNNKRLYARGNVNGMANITIGPVIAGDGGWAYAEAADGDPGGVCEDGQDGGSATAIGGDGGDASMNVRGLGITVGAVIGGDGGDAEAYGGDGGDGGICPCFMTFGGEGGSASATPGAGGEATGGNPNTPGEAGDPTQVPGEPGDGFIDICIEAMDLFLQGDFWGALELLDQYIVENPLVARAFISRAIVRHAMGDSLAALDDLGAALLIDPLNAYVYHNAGIINFDIGHHDDALVSFEHAIELDPDLADAYYGMAIIYDGRGETDAALEAYQRFLEVAEEEDELTEYARQRIEELGGEVEPGAFEVEGMHICSPTPPCQVQIVVYGEPGADVEAVVGPLGQDDLGVKEGTIGDDGTLTLSWDVYTHDIFYAIGEVDGESFLVEIPAP